MRVFVDGDACNMITTIETIVSKYNIECHIYCDTTRIINTRYATVHVMDKGQDSVDFAIANKCVRNDIVITNDTGLAALALAKNSYVMNTFGNEYTNRNIMSYLNRRYIRIDAHRKSGRDQVNGYDSMCRQGKFNTRPHFKTSFTKLILKAKEQCVGVN